MDDLPTADALIERHFGLDWLRVAAFMLLILNHVGMYFVPDPWLVKWPVPLRGLVWPLLAMQPWRLPLLFAVSGYASCALLSKSGGALPFLRARSYRLLVPLAFGVLVIVPPQTWVSMVENHGYRAGLAHFWTHDWLSFRSVLGVALPSTEHLWFIAYLWAYTSALCVALLVLPPAWRDRAKADLVVLLSHPRRLIPLLAGLVLLRIGLLFTVPEVKGTLHDWIGDLTYVPIFLFGFALAATPALWPAVLRLRRPALGVAAFSLAVLVVVELNYPGQRPHLPQAADRAATLLMAWSMVVLLLGAAHQWLRFDHPWRRTLSEAVFPFYLIHQTIIVLIGWRLRDSGLGPLTAFLVLTGVTLGGSCIFYLAGRRIGWLRPLIGLAGVRSREARPFRPAIGGA